MPPRQRHYARGLCHKCYRRAWQAENPDKVRAYSKTHYDAHDDKRRAYGRAYFAANRERLLDGNRLYRAANANKIRASVRTYHRTARGLLVKRAAQHRRRTRSGTELATDTIQRVLQSAGGLCAYCQMPSDRLQIDHYLPISRGGTNDDVNLRAACPECNYSKHAKMPEPWLLSRAET